VELHSVMASEGLAQLNIPRRDGREMHHFSVGPRGVIARSQSIGESYDGHRVRQVLIVMKGKCLDRRSWPEDAPDFGNVMHQSERPDIRPDPSVPAAAGSA